MAKKEKAREAGADAMASVRKRVAEKVADLIRRDEDRAAQALEMGIVDRAWLDDPGNQPLRTASTMDVVQRFLERSVEQEPSLLASLGLSAVQLLANETGEEGIGSATRPVTVVFTDLEGFTRFTAREGDAAAVDLVKTHNQAVGPVVRGRGGRIVKRLGDGLMLTFDTPESGVLAAVDLVDTGTVPLKVRAGVHVGEAVVSVDDVVGHVVNVAARVTDEAKGGETLATVDVRSAAGDVPGVRFGRARRRTFKGLTESISVCPVSRA